MTEGEDLLDAGRAAGARAALGADRGRQRARWRGGRAPSCWPMSRPWAPGPGRSRSGRCAGRDSVDAPCIYLHGVADPGNVGAIVRTATRCSAARSCSALIAPTPTGRSRCGRAWARSSPGPPVRADVEATPEPRAALVAHGGAGIEALEGAATLCLGAEREGLPQSVIAACERRVTIPLPARRRRVAQRRRCRGRSLRSGYRRAPCGRPTRDA